MDKNDLKKTFEYRAGQVLTASICACIIAIAIALTIKLLLWLF